MRAETDCSLWNQNSHDNHPVRSIKNNYIITWRTACVLSLLSIYMLKTIVSTVSSTRVYIQALYRHGVFIGARAQWKRHPQLLPWQWNQDCIQVVQRWKATDQCDEVYAVTWSEAVDHHTRADGRWWHIQLCSGESCGQHDKPAYQTDCLQ